MKGIISSRYLIISLLVLMSLVLMSSRSMAQNPPSALTTNLPPIVYQRVIDSWLADAQAGNASAEQRLIFSYEQLHQYPQVFYWTKRWADETQDALAQADLASFYMVGHGVKPNLAQAMYYFKLSAAQGNLYAQSSLASLYASQGNYPKALYWNQHSESYPQSAFNLGMTYEYGDGVQPSWKKAQHYFTKAASKGYVQAVLELGETYAQTYQNYPAAYVWLKVAATRYHNADAQHDLEVVMHYMSEEQIQVADKQYQDYINAHPFSHESLNQYGLGRTQFNIGSYNVTNKLSKES